MASQSQPVVVGPSAKMKNVQFYRRPLPQTCIDFASEEGRIIFKEALNSGHMTCYFKLSSQFRTQDEPAYCGLTSLVMTLNVLEIDPGRVWKGPWRWYHEEMLDCCISLDIVKEKGINLEQFVCIARCNNLSANHLSATHFESVDEFRALIKEKTQVENQVVIVSYSRGILGQSGSGHFSPIAGYHEDKDLVLILDTARFKYPPHWIPVTLLMEAMKIVDAETGNPRGIVLLSKTEGYVGTLLYRPSCSLLISEEKGTIPKAVLYFTEAWNKWLDEKQETDTPQRSEFVQQFVKIILDSLNNTQLLCLVTPNRTDGKCGTFCCHMKCKNISPEEEEGIRALYISLMEELESLKTYEVMKEVVASMSKEERVQLMRLVACSEYSCSEASLENVNGEYCNLHACPQQLGPFAVSNNSKRKWSVSLKITPENVLTIMFLMWPACKRGNGNSVRGCYEEGSRRDWLNSWLMEDLKGFPKRTIRQEVVSLNFKVVEVLNYHSDSYNFVPIKGFV